MVAVETERIAAVSSEQLIEKDLGQMRAEVSAQGTEFEVVKAAEILGWQLPPRSFVNKVYHWRVSLLERGEAFPTFPLSINELIALKLAIILAAQGVYWEEVRGVLAKVIEDDLVLSSFVKREISKEYTSRQVASRSKTPGILEKQFSSKTLRPPPWLRLSWEEKQEEGKVIKWAKIEGSNEPVLGRKTVLFKRGRGAEEDFEDLERRPYPKDLLRLITTRDPRIFNDAAHCFYEVTTQELSRLGEENGLGRISSEDGWALLHTAAWQKTKNLIEKGKKQVPRRLGKDYEIEEPVYFGELASLLAEVEKLLGKDEEVTSGEIIRRIKVRKLHTPGVV